MTLDIVPLLRCMSDLGRLEDTMYLSMFAMEEAKHTDMFRRWFDAVGIDPSSLDDLVRARSEQADGSASAGRRLFDGALTPGDAPARHRPVTARRSSTRRWSTTSSSRASRRSPATSAGTRRSAGSASSPAWKRDSSSPSATSDATSPTAPTWAGASSPRTRSCGSGSSSAGPSSPPASSGYGEAGEPTQEPGLGIDFEYQRQLARRRLEALAVARTMNLSEVDASAVEAFEPQELQHVS